MDKGHLDQTRKNQRSTKPALIETSEADAILSDTDSFPSPSEDKTHHCYVAILEPTGQIFTDQTGRFVIPSSNGNNYLIVLYGYDSNHIFAQPFKSRTAHCITEAYKILHQRLCNAGFKPKLQHLDNECSKMLKRFLKLKDVDFQLVPPGVHRRNAAECAICTFQNHFIAGRCSTDKDFPLHLWDELIPQAELTLNLLRNSQFTPKLSIQPQTLRPRPHQRTI
jgi:hypothetical protein